MFGTVQERYHTQSIHDNRCLSNTNIHIVMNRVLVYTQHTTYVTFFFEDGLRQRYTTFFFKKKYTMYWEHLMCPRYNVILHGFCTEGFTCILHLHTSTFPMQAEKPYAKQKKILLNIELNNCCIIEWHTRLMRTCNKSLCYERSEQYCRILSRDT